MIAKYTAKCLTCGRVRHFGSAEAAAKAASSGRVCRAKVRRAAIEQSLDGFTEAQKTKALELITDGGLVPLGRPGAWKAVGSDGVTVYLVTARGCNCPHGLKVTSGAARPCYHRGAAAVLEATRKAA